MRDRLIRQLSILALALAAIAIILAIMLLAVTRSNAAAACLSKAEARALYPKAHLYWHTKNRCWNNNARRSVNFRGKKIAPDLLPVHAEVKKINLDANGGDPTPADEVMEKPQPQDECCWPPLDERSFKSRWDELPAQWLVKFK